MRCEARRCPLDLGLFTFFLHTDGPWVPHRVDSWLPVSLVLLGPLEPPAATLAVGVGQFWEECLLRWAPPSDRMQSACGGCSFWGRGACGRKGWCDVSADQDHVAVTGWVPREFDIDPVLSNALQGAIAVNRGSVYAGADPHFV